MDFARALAGRIVAADEGSVRRVVLVGSRAKAISTDRSDLDLVCVIELPDGAPPWGYRDCVAAKERMLRTIGRAACAGPPRLDLWVRTTDQFEEGRRVIGGVESLVEVEGVEVYSTPSRRAPVTRRTRDQVRRANVGIWIEHAVLALEQARRVEHAALLRSSTSAAAWDAGELAWQAVRCALNALLVAHQVRSTKQDPLDDVLEKLACVEPAFEAALRPRLPAHDGAVPAIQAHAVVSAVLHRTLQDPAMERYVGGFRARLAKPVPHVGGTG